MLIAACQQSKASRLGKMQENSVTVKIASIETAASVAVLHCSKGLHLAESVSTDCKTGRSEVAAFLTSTEIPGMTGSGRQQTKGLILNKVSLIGGRRPNHVILRKLLNVLN